MSADAPKPGFAAPPMPLPAVVGLDLMWMAGGVLLYGLALLPPVAVLRWAVQHTPWPAWALALPVAYFAFLLSLAAAMGAVARTLPPLRPGTYKMNSPDHVRLYLHMGLYNYVATTGLIHHLQLMTTTRWLFYRALGARLDRTVMIAPHTLLSEPSLLTVGRHTLIGGHAYLTGHLAKDLNEFVIAPVHIGERAFIGGGVFISPGVRVGDGALVSPFCVLLPDAEVGAGARVLANSVVSRGTHIPPGETWGGVPARPLRAKADAHPAG